MTLTLCIETSSAYCSVALAVEDQLFEDTRLLQRTHNDHLLEMIDGLYAKASANRRDTELIGFSCGPGSFTGVRIAAAAAQAMALASDAKVVPIPSPLVRALNAEHERPADRPRVVSIRSRGDAYYFTLFDPGAVVTLATELVSSTPGWLEDRFEVVGDLPDWLQLANDSQHADVTPGASVMVAYVRLCHDRGESVRAELALPTYIEGDSPWQKKARQ